MESESGTTEVRDPAAERVARLGATSLGDEVGFVAARAHKYVAAPTVRDLYRRQAAQAGSTAVALFFEAVKNLGFEHHKRLELIAVARCQVATWTALSVSAGSIRP